jgi:hypothetical protein
MATTTAQDAYVELLFEKVREDQYPSGELLDRIERSMATKEHASEYLEILISKVDSTRYPSHQLLDRIERLARVFRSAGR